MSLMDWLTFIPATIAGGLGSYLWNRFRLPKHKAKAAREAVQAYKAEQAQKQHADHFHGEIGKIMGVPIIRSPFVPPGQAIMMNTEMMPDFFKDEPPRMHVRVGPDLVLDDKRKATLQDEIQRLSDEWMTEWVKKNAEPGILNPFVRLGDSYRPEVDDVDAHRFIFTEYAKQDNEPQVREDVKPDAPEVHRTDSSGSDSGGSDPL